jgi:pentatricopeptide repeat protein
MKLAKVLLVAVALSLVATLAACENQERKAEEEFELVMEEVREESKTASPQQFSMVIEEKMGAFIEKYPGTLEAAKAELIMGKFYTQIGRFEDAIVHLRNFIDSGFLREGNDVAAASYSLANCYIRLEKFDEAEEVLDSMLKWSGLDQKGRAVVSQQLSQLGTLRRLVTGKEAIDFSATTDSGKKISLEDYRGDVVLLDFWASWCAPCIREMPNVKSVYDKFHHKGFEIIGISLDKSEKKFRSYIKEQDISWPQIFDGGSGAGGIARKYAVNAIPATFLIDREGRIAAKNMRGPQLGKAVSDLVEGR